MLAQVKQPRGISLIEVLVVLVVLGVLLAVAAPSLYDMLSRRRVQSVAEQIAADLATARAEGGLRVGQYLTVRFEANSSMSCYTMMYGGTANGKCDCTQGVGNACSVTGAEFKTVQVPAGAHVSFVPDSTPWSESNISPVRFNYVSFTSPQMMVSVGNGLLSPETIKINVSSIPAKFSLRVLLTPAGQISICAPNGDFSGVSLCPAS